MRVNIINILGLLLVVYLIVNCGVYLFQNRIIYQPKKLAADYIFSLKTPWKEFFLPVGTQDSIHALLISPTEQPEKGIVVYFHGNRGNLSRWANMHEDFTKHGFSFLVIDYRGYGRSSGKPSELNLYEDGKAAYDWAAAHYSSDKIIIYGRSLGTGVACHVAEREEACALGLETPFSSVRSAMQKAGGLLWLPFPLRSEFRNDSRVPKISYPIHIFQGTKDRIVPFRDAKKLKPLLKPNDVFMVIPKGRHNNLNTYVKFQKGLEKLLILD